MENIIQNYIDDLRIAKSERIDKSNGIYERIMNDPELSLEGKAHIFGVHLTDTREHFLNKALFWLHRRFAEFGPAELFAIERYIITNFGLYEGEELVTEFLGSLHFDTDLCGGPVFVTNRRFIVCGMMVPQNLRPNLSSIIAEVAREIAAGGKVGYVIDRKSEIFLNRIFKTVARFSPGFQVPFFNAENFQFSAENIFDFRACIPMEDNNGEATMIFQPMIRVTIMNEKEEEKNAFIQRCRQLIYTVQQIIKS